MKTQRLAEKLIVTLYFLLNLADPLRIGYYWVFFLKLAFEDHRIGSYLITGVIVIVHIGFIVALILSYFRNTKLFLWVAASDFLLYTISWLYVEIMNEFLGIGDINIAFTILSCVAHAALLVALICALKKYKMRDL